MKGRRLAPKKRMVAGSYGGFSLTDEQKVAGIVISTWLLKKFSSNGYGHVRSALGDRLKQLYGGSTVMNFSTSQASNYYKNNLNSCISDNYSQRFIESGTIMGPRS